MMYSLFYKYIATSVIINTLTNHVCQSQKNIDNDGSPNILQIYL